MSKENDFTDEQKHTVCKPLDHIKQDVRWLDYLDLGTWREPEPGAAEEELEIALREFGHGRPLG